jgi:Lipid A 3-O-deacylase (PagL)
VALLFAADAHAQEGAVEQAVAIEPASPSPWFVRAALSPAWVLTSSHFETSGDGARAFTIEVGLQTDGSRSWHRVYNYPSYGIGFAAGRFDRDREIGRPYSAYGFFSWPFPLSPRAQLSADVALGLAWNWNEFDRQTNAANTAFGSDIAYQVDGGVSVRFLATSRASLYAGVNLTHWSNGATSQPNLGLANLGPKVGVRYDFAPRRVRPRASASELPPFTPSWHLVAGGAGSSKSAVAKTSTHVAISDRWRDFSAFNLTGGVERSFYRFGTAAAGADFTYDGATGARVERIGGEHIDARAPVDERFGAGLYAGYEHLIARVGVLAQFGYTVWQGFEDDEVPRFYQRYGTRFYLSERFWGLFAVRAMKFRKANNLEIGLGYRARLR